MVGEVRTRHGGCTFHGKKDRLKAQIILALDILNFRSLRDG
jgi:hypothetical protein